jgi:hypothetical protein
MTAVKLTDPFIAALVREAYAVHYMLTNLGFEPAEVQACIRTVANADPPEPYACVLLERAGKQFVVHLQPVTEEQEALFQQAWLAFAEAKRRMTRAELDALVTGSELYARRDELLWALVDRGFELRPGGMLN